MKGKAGQNDNTPGSHKENVVPQSDRMAALKAQAAKVREARALEERHLAEARQHEENARIHGKNAFQLRMQNITESQQRWAETNSAVAELEARRAVKPVGGKGF